MANLELTDPKADVADLRPHTSNLDHAATPRGASKPPQSGAAPSAQEAPATKQDQPKRHRTAQTTGPAGTTADPLRALVSEALKRRHGGGALSGVLPRGHAALTSLTAPITPQGTGSATHGPQHRTAGRGLGLEGVADRSDLPAEASLPRAASNPTASPSARRPVLEALDRAFPRAAEAANLPADREAALPFADPLDPQVLRAALAQLLEDDLRRHGLSPLGGL